MHDDAVLGVHQCDGWGWGVSAGCARAGWLPQPLLAFASLLTAIRLLAAVLFPLPPHLSAAHSLAARHSHHSLAYDAPPCALLSIASRCCTPIRVAVAVAVRRRPRFLRPPSSGDLASVEDLLAQGEDVNCRGAQNRTPLHRAVGKGHNAVVQQLIRQGADLSLLDQGGLTPLSEQRRTGGDDAVRRAG